jgi:predicted ATP-grasp superfamily ATP-dependent carboligase
MRILVTDGQNTNTLVVLRSLGQKYQIDITSRYSKLATLGSYSTFCNKTWLLKSDIHNPESYSEELLSILTRQKYDLMLPVGLDSNLAVSKYKAEFQRKTRLAIVDFDKMQIAYSRFKAMSYAKSLGVPIPRSYDLDVESVDSVERYPVVLKSSNDGVGSARFCNDSRELEKNLAYFTGRGGTGIIAQEYIYGSGCGFFGVYNNAKLVAYFMHRRIMEFPATGGPSAIAESFFNEKLFNYGQKLGESLGWHGPMMAEFKYVDNDFKLIEINPKLWGSMDLTISAGVNVPEILAGIALGRETNYVSSYDHLKFRWVFPNQWLSLISAFSWRGFLQFFQRDAQTRTNLNFADPLPTLYQILTGFVRGCLMLLSARKRSPHGKIMAVNRAVLGQPAIKKSIILE